MLCEVHFRLGALVEALVFRDNASDAVAFAGRFAAAIRKDKLRAAKLLEHIDARGFYQPAEPLGQFAQ